MSNSIYTVLFGNTNRNKVLEFFLSLHGKDYSIGDVARELKMKRATAYRVVQDFVKAEWISPSRKISGIQLYALNYENRYVQILIRINSVLVEEWEKR